MRIGIIGYGRFGKLWAKLMADLGHDVLVYQKHEIRNKEIKNKRIKFDKLAEVVKTNILFLLVPISGMENCCKQIASFLNPRTIVVDACSVKIYPMKMMKKYLPKNQTIIPSHPLFGPDSVKRSGVKDQKIVICAKNSQKTAIFIKLLTSLKLKIVFSSAAQHDRMMARSQALVHFIGRGLTALNLKEQKISTPDYQTLLAMNEMVKNDTWELFYDMERFNPYARIIRKRLVKGLIKLEKNIEY